jgi:hypothetical protein
VAGPIPEAYTPGDLVWHVMLAGEHDVEAEPCRSTNIIWARWEEGPETRRTRPRMVMLATACTIEPNAGLRKIPAGRNGGRPCEGAY